MAILRVTEWFKGHWSKECNVLLVLNFFLSFKDIEPYNTRLFKTEKQGKVCYELRLASALTTSEFCLSLFVCLSVSLSVCLCPPLSVHPSVCPSVCPSVRSSVCLSVCLSVCSSVHLFVSLFVQSCCSCYAQLNHLTKMTKFPVCWVNTASNPVLSVYLEETIPLSCKE